MFTAAVYHGPRGPAVPEKLIPAEGTKVYFPESEVGPPLFWTARKMAIEATSGSHHDKVKRSSTASIRYYIGEDRPIPFTQPTRPITNLCIWMFNSTPNGPDFKPEDLAAPLPPPYSNKRAYIFVKKEGDGRICFSDPDAEDADFKGLRAQLVELGKTARYAVGIKDVQIHLVDEATHQVMLYTDASSEATVGLPATVAMPTHSFAVASQAILLEGEDELTSLIKNVEGKKLVWNGYLDVSTLPGIPGSEAASGAGAGAGDHHPVTGGFFVAAAGAGSGAWHSPCLE
jgi:hypothetical protein